VIYLDCDRLPQNVEVLSHMRLDLPFREFTT
jgi:hypothetical protein